jgi:ubiquinone/menaquinone biosynthesis C-methylase UbiE
MNINEAIHLIRDMESINPKPNTWADLGCGSGTFTKALALVLPSQSTIYAVDKNRNTIGNDAEISIENIQMDFVSESLPFHDLDGILMANSLHYVKYKIELLQKLKGHVIPNAQFLIIEYETKSANPWVPFPIPYEEVKALFLEVGFNTSTYLGERDSKYGDNKMYACVLST